MSQKLSSICVYCGANPGFSPVYKDAAIALADTPAAAGITLVYGGSSVGLMGTIADRVLMRGGQAIGVIPQALVDKELAHHGLTELHVVPSMHARKAKMAELADAFIAMPGGMGTLEELFEMLTWAQLGLHKKAARYSTLTVITPVCLIFLRTPPRRASFATNIATCSSAMMIQSSSLH